MTSPRALIEMVVDGAAESRRRVESVADALRQMNGQSLQNISNQMNSLNDRFTGLQSTIGNVTSFAIAGVSLATLGSKVVGVLDSMGELDDLSQKIGTSVESLSRIQRVAKTFGVDFAGTVDPAMVKLARNLTTVDDKSSRTSKALAAIGVSAKDSAGKLRDPGEVMIEVAKNLAQYEDGAGKAAVVTDLFGKSGADLLPFLNDLADNVDKFSSVTPEAVKQATDLQDKFGMLSQRTDQAFTSIVTAALPALTGLSEGFSDVLEAESGLINNGEIAEWAGMAAMGIARVADVAVLAVRGFSAISSSLGVITSDLEVLWTASPANMGLTLAKGGSPLADLKKVVAERNQVLEAANAKWAAFYNADGNMFEQAVKKRLSAKVDDAKPPADEKPKDKDLNGYKPGSDAADKDAEKQANAYQNLTKAIQAKIVQANLELSAGAPLLASQQEQLSLTEQLAEMKGKLTPIQYAYLESQAKELVTKLEVIESNKRAAEGLESYTKLRVAYETSAAKAVENAQTEAERNEQLALSFGRTTGQIAALELARLEEQLAQRSSAGLTLNEIENLEKLIAAKKRSSTALGKIDGFEASKKSIEELDAFLDPAKAQSFGEALRESLGGAGTALSALTSTLDGFGKRQAEIDKHRATAERERLIGAMSEQKYISDIARLNEMETKNRLSGYGDMAGAASGFFGEQSRGYQALMTVSKVFHAAELAMTMAELVPKGIAAVLNQGTGDPYSAFGRMAAMAAVVAGLGVAIGGVSGSNVSLSESRQKEQGTGTVLGSDAKSGSIARALAEIEQSSQGTLGVNNDMLISLRNIESGIGQFASLLVRTTGVTGEFGKDMNKGAFDSKAIGIGGAAAGGIGGAMAGAYVGMGTSQIGLLLGGPIGMALGAVLGAVIGKTVIGKALGSVFGGKQTVEDTGFTLGKSSYGNILKDGVNASQYADVKKDGGWFRSDKNSTQMEGLGAEGNRQIASVLTSLYDTVFKAGTILGLGADSFNAQLSSFVVDIGKVSLKGLSDDEIQEELQAVFSKVGDNLAASGVAGLETFQKVGEGYLETLARVASNYQSLDAIMASIGSTVGAAGVASVPARERLIDMSGGISALASQVSSFADNFLTEAERLAPVQKFVSDQLASIGMAWVDNSVEFKNAALGIDKTTEAGAKQFTVMMSLADAFAKVYPAAKDLSMSMQEIADERSTLQDKIDELSMTREQLLAKERSALHGTNRPLWDRVQGLQAEAAAQEKRAQERTTLQEQLDQLTMTREQLLARERAALDEGNRPLWDRIKALEAETLAAQSAKDAAAGLLGGVDSAFAVLERVVDRERTVLQTQIASHTDAANKLRTVSDSLRSTISSMSAPEDAAVSRTRAQSDLRSFLAIARTGGVFPDSTKLQATLGALSADASSQFESFADYQRDFYSTRNDMSDLAALSDAALSTEERALETLQEQLDAYDAMLKHEQEQIDILKGQSTTGLSILDAVRALRGAVLAAQSNPVVAAGSAINSAYQTHLGRAPDAAGFEWWNNAAASGTPVSQIVSGIASSTEADLNKLYESVLGRKPDAEGLAFWMKAYGSTMDAAETADFVKAAQTTDEYKKLNGIPGFAAGGDHSGGWRIVGENGPELEATGAARIFNAQQTRNLMGQLSSPSEGNAVLVAELRAVRAELELLRTENSAENAAIAKGAQATASHLDAAINGDTPFATKVIKEVVPA